MAVTKDTSEQTMSVARALAICGGCPAASCCGAKRLVLGVLVRILLAIVELLLERFGFLLIGKGQTCKTVFELKSVEEDTVLVVCEGVVYFLVPDDTSAGWRYVHQLKPECVPYQVVCQHDGALKPSISPSVPVRVGNIQLGDSDGVDLVGRLGHSALHCLLVLVGQDRGHGGEGGRCSSY